MQLTIIPKARCNSRNYSANNDSTPNIVKTLLMRFCTFAFFGPALWGLIRRLGPGFFSYFRPSVLSLVTVLSLILLPGCTSGSGNNDHTPPPALTERGDGVFILNEGVFMDGNASLSFYDYGTGKCEQDLFFQANNAPLGDIPTSMTLRNGLSYITLSNSGNIYVIDPVTCKYTGKISGLSSPRHITFISESKAYVSNLTAGVIDIIDLSTLKVTGSIDLGKGRYAEQMILHQGFVYTNLWSYGTQILRIDPSSDQVVDSLEIGIQPQSLFVDSRGLFWTLADGGYEGSPIGFSDPEIVCFDPLEMKVLKRFTIKRTAESMLFNLKMTMVNDKIYYISQNLYTMSVDDLVLPTAALVTAQVGQSFYSVGVDPVTGDIFVGDAVDYMQDGVVYHYNMSGEKIDEFKVGIIPGAFCFYDDAL